MNLQRMQQLAGIKLTESVSAIPGIGKIEEKSTSPAQAKMMAAIAHGWKKPGGEGPSKSVAKEFNKADTGTKQLSKAMKHKTEESIELGDNTLGEPGWYIVNGQGAVSSGPYQSEQEARSDSGRMRWFNHTDSILHGVEDEDGNFVEADMDESAGDYRQNYMDANKPSKHEPSQHQRPKQTPWSVDPIAAATDRIYDKFSSKKPEDNLGEAPDEIDNDEWMDSGADQDRSQDPYYNWNNNTDRDQQRRDDGEMDEGPSIDDLFDKEHCTDYSMRQGEMGNPNMRSDMAPHDDRSGVDDREFDDEEEFFEEGPDSRTTARLRKEVSDRKWAEHAKSDQRDKDAEQKKSEDKVEEDFDLNNGYGDINDASGNDYFPNGADSPVVKTTGSSGARQGDNPEQKKVQIAEVHKELVYGYRNYLRESSKK